MRRTNLPRVEFWLLAFGALLLGGAHAGVFAQPVPVAATAASAPSAFEVASAQLDARETLKSLSSEGQLLYQRERVKLTGYQYCSQAVAQAERGDFRDSLQSAAKALHIGEMQGNDDLIAVSKRDLAIAYSYAGDLDSAKRYAEQALTHRAKNPALVVGPAYKTLGDVAVRRGAFDEAIALYGQAAAASSERFRPLVQLSLANAYVAKKDAAKARALYDALPALQGTLVPEYQRGLGNLLLIEDRPSDALASFEAAARSAGGTDADYHRVWAVEGSARALLALGDKAAARARYLEAAKLSEGFRARFRSDEFKTGLFGNVQQIFDGAINMLAEEGDDAGAWSLSERSRSRALLDVLRDRVKSPASAGDGGLEAAEVARLSDVTAMLRENETLLQFHSLDARLLVWTINASGLKATSLPVPRAELKSLIEAFRSLVRSRLLGATDASTALYDRLLASLVLPAGNSLVIVPHGDLHYLPFQALRSPDGFLIERHPIAVEPSASVAVQLRRRHAEAGGRLVAFGNPVNTAPFDLPAAEREVESISQMFADHQVYFHENASKSRFREAAGSGRILLVAAHAELDPNDVLASKIRLAAETDDLGFLLAREIYGLDLTRVSLVTLSACSSGLGRIVGGGDLVGFTRSFLSAGASSLLVSLWPVDDVSTQLLMSTFYAQLTKGIEAIDALRAAQLAVLARPRSGHPYYWAPFNLIGDWRLQINR